MALFLLYENASGYALFERVASEEVGITLEEVQKSIKDLKRFSAIVKLHAFQPFLSAESALENINAVTEGQMTEALGNFLEQNVPKGKKKKEGKESSKSVQLGVNDPKIGNAISEALGVSCLNNDVVSELIRGIREHFPRFVKVLKAGDIQQAQLGLGHAYSRAKVKFNVHRQDNMLIQAIALLDQLDKDLNTFSMRVREWYGYHFPEMVAIVNDNYLYCRTAQFIKDKKTLTDDSRAGLIAILNDETKAQQVIDAAKMSMGQDISPIDLINIEQFATQVAKLTEYRKELFEYLSAKMNVCAPNLSALIGEQVGARLISHAGSLTSLAKYPASTVQILGAEKALFRALKTKGNTPKYGLIFHSSFIGRAGAKNKGRISRYLANKCSIASRIDSFSEPSAAGAPTTNQFGVMLRQQVEERLEFYKSGATPQKNLDVMAKVMAALGDAAGSPGTPAESSSSSSTGDKKKKKKSTEETKEAVVDDEAAAKAAKKAKKDKRKLEEAAAAAPAAMDDTEDNGAKKSKKAKKEKK